MMRILPVLAILLLCACSHGEDYSNPYVYNVRSAGTLMPGINNNNASVSFTGSYHAGTGSFSYYIKWKNLSSSPAGGGLYAAPTLPAANAELISWQFPQALPTSGEWHAFRRSSL
ncbi:MAG: hypothetical protein EOP51_18285, partial [Sphingobacteriales bacterium]